MPDFGELRAELAALKRQIDEKRVATMLAHEAVQRARRALMAFARSRTSRDNDEAARLREKVTAAEEVEATLRGELAQLRSSELAILRVFEALTDPREQLGRFSDDTPILLFPLRLETRFKASAEGKPQLWLRVYPDNCLIDTFEASLAEQEVVNAQAFWARFWSAAEDETLERAAWRELVAAHGSGRAAWIISHYTPRNPGDRPLDTDAADVRLIITSEAEAALPDAVADYWEAAWRAVDDPDAQAQALTDLQAALGADEAARVVEKYKPFNFDDTPPDPLTRANAQLLVRVLQVQSLGSIEARRTSWSSPSRIDLLPERFVFVGYHGADVRTEIGGIIRTPLVASPDPNAPDAEALKQVDDQMQIPPDIAWMFDFQTAVDAGMAMRIDISADQARDGFDRVVVLGVRLADTPTEGRANLAALLEHHLHSRAGLSFVQQGTPTNNTEQQGAGYTFRDDSESTFDVFVRKNEQYPIEPEPLLRLDGQWLAELLALPHQLIQRIPGASGTDQRDARAMQIALWPGTLGYMMKTQLAPVFADADVEWTRTFFTRYVTGRGPIPALRIGRQPYGILPTTAFSRIAWVDTEAAPRLHRLHEILKKVDADWKPLLDRVSHIGKQGGDPHQILLDVLGLHPTSAEYYPLQAESVEHKFFELSFFDFSIASGVLGLFPALLPLTLLRGFGYAGDEIPELLNKIFKARQTPLTGPLVDDRPLSEIDAIRDYAGDQNYIEWLAAAARQGIEALQQEQGFDGGKRPAALLYLQLRHALQQAFHETAIKLHIDAGALIHAAMMRREPAFVHVADSQSSESGYELLFHTEERVTHSANMKVGDYIAQNIATVDVPLPEQLSALDRLAPLSTAKLERLFAEHVDCCTYRSDAWKQGMLLQRMEALRHPVRTAATGRSVLTVAVGPVPEPPGLYLGAVGWLEPLRPRDGALTPADLPDDVAEVINQRTQVPLMRDSANGGLIHAPSINHATTAAVLRNGYLANDGRLAVNVTSRRVRLALEILEGMRNGQSLGALLGYQFERYVHDNGPLGVRDLIYPVRRAFPLAANQIAATNADAASGAASESIAAMNVVDGRKFIEHVESGTPLNVVYPFGVSTLPSRGADQEKAMTDALAHIRDINDAVSDLVLAEGVHQAVLGNYERSAGTLDAFAKGNHPPEPDVVRTPRTGVGLTLRTAIHLSTAPAADPLPGITLTPLATAEPAVNVWLRDRLPAPATVGCRVTFTDRADDTEKSLFVDQEQLGLHPIDLLYRVQANAEQALGEIDELTLRYVQANRTPRHDKPIVIQHTVRVPNRFNWFELQTLVRSCRSLFGSRPLQPSDLMRANDADKEQQAAIALPAARVETPRDDLNDTLLPTLDTLTTALNDAAVTVDAAIVRFADTVSKFAAYRLPQTGIGFVYEWRAGAYTALAEKLRERVKDWDRRLARFDTRLAEYDALPGGISDEDRFKALKSAELLVSTALTLPEPPSPANYRTVVLVARRGAFVAKRAAIAERYTVARATLTALLADAKALLPLDAFDLNELDFSDDEAEITRFRMQLVAIVAALKADVVKRLARVETLLGDHDTATSGAARAELLQKAGKILFGDDFQFVPHIALPAALSAELANAWDYSATGKLTRYLTDTRGRDFPVDDWLHGIARVRDKMRHWENVVLLDEAVGASQPELTPLQLPHADDQPWLALEFPEDYEIVSERLLYTAHFTDVFDATKPVCGLLLDEWTEVIPATRETTGIAFHYDRPNSEPPQSWLLAIPASRDGAWSWEELLAIVVDTLNSAKCRAIEPAHVDQTAYSWFLPATMSAYTFPEIAISNNLLLNRRIYTDFVLPGEG